MNVCKKVMLVLSASLIIPTLLSCDVEAKTHGEYMEDIVFEVNEQYYEPEPEPEPEEESEPELEMTESQRAAYDKAVSYVDTISYSYDRLFKQLVQDGFSLEDSVFAVDNCGADWDEQAARRVKAYFTFMGFSYDMVVEQLLYDGFTEEQAYRAADNCGADWDEQAVYMARDYIRTGMFGNGDRQRLANILVEEGFTAEQAEYALSKVWFGQ